MSKDEELLERIHQLNRIGVALSWHRDTTRLLETILESARDLTGADGGTLYLVSGENVSFEIMQTESLGIYLGGTTGRPVQFDPLPLFVDDEPNRSTVVTSCIHERTSINIADTHKNATYDFSGTRRFDDSTGYDSRSLLAVPMLDHEGEVIAALQLINAIDDAGQVVPFDDESHQLAESLASQAAVALTNKHLIDGLRDLFESFVRLIAEAIDEKSPYTGAHCRRVPPLTLMLADAACQTRTGELAAFSLSDNERYALDIAAWLHDCGKITTPEHVMDKSTKLETVDDGIERVATRFAVCKAELEGRRLREHIAVGRDTEDAAAIDARFAQTATDLDEELAFLRRLNAGEVTVDDAALARIEQIGQRHWTDAAGQSQPLLTSEEKHNLAITRGTLNDQERQIIQNHAAVSLRMLNQLPFPGTLAHVPEYAGGHHERVDGLGYPQGLRREEMSVPARAMAIADVFEALSANDRPYKSARPLSDCLRILGYMVEDGHIDPDLFAVFIDHRIYEQYAERFLSRDQIDEVDLASIPGYHARTG